MGISALLAVGSMALAAAASILLMPELAQSAVRMSASVEARARLYEEASPGRAEGANRQGERHRSRARVLAAVVLEGGFPPLRKAARVLLGVAPVRLFFELAVRRLASRGLRCTDESLCQAAIPLCACLMLIFGALLGSAMLGFLLTALMLWLLMRSMRKEELAEQEELARLLPDAVRALGTYYETGLSLMQAFEQVSGEMPEPLATRLAAVASDIRVGRSVEQALERFRLAVDDDAISFVAVALEVQQRTGGALQPLLERAADGMVEARELRRFMEVHTAQSRLSARVVAIMPLAVFGIMSLVDSHYALALFSSPFGIGLFVTACLLEAAGVLAIRKILASSTGGIQ